MKALCFVFLAAVGFVSVVICFLWAIGAFGLRPRKWLPVVCVSAAYLSIKCMGFIQ